MTARGRRDRTPPITRVTGGVAGLTATYAAMLALADRFSVVAGRLTEAAASGAKLLVDPDLVESAPLSPVTFAEAEARVVDATTGIHGVLEAAAACEADALLIRATVTAYQECDREVAASLDVVAYAVGRAGGSTLRGLGAWTLPLGVAAEQSWRALPVAARRRLEAAAEDAVDEHPEIVEGAVDGAGGLVDGLLGLPPVHRTEADAASWLARFYPPEGVARVRVRPDLATRLGSTPPRDLAGLLRHLEQTNDLSAPDRPGDEGTIEVQTLRGSDGSSRHIVYLPGTDDITTTPWSHDGDVRDLTADLRAAAGEHTTYAAGIEHAMTRAGIGPHDPVLLVGHSLGGMEAASMLAHRSGFDVTHVVTAGAPLSGVPGYPTGAHVLSLENRGDVVPLLDGHDNPDSVQQVTVQFDDSRPGDGTSVVGAHALRHYVHGAAAAEASRDPSIREELQSLHAHGFLGSGARATCQVFQIVR